MHYLSSGIYYTFTVGGAPATIYYSYHTERNTRAPHDLQYKAKRLRVLR